MTRDEIEKKAFAKAVAYVEAKDYLFDESRETAGNAYIAGYLAGRDDALEEAASTIDKVIAKLLEADPNDIGGFAGYTTTLADGVRALKTEKK